MGRKGTQTLLNALLIPYVGINFLENRQLAAVSGGNVEAGLAH